MKANIFSDLSGEKKKNIKKKREEWNDQSVGIWFDP